MTRFTRWAVLLALLVACSARADDKPKDEEAKKAVKKLVDRMMDATIKGDYEAVIGLTHPAAVKHLGGKKEALETVKTAMGALKAQGIEIRSLKAGDPSTPVTAGKTVFIFVPTALELKSPQGKVTGTSYVLGVSEDQGKTWAFVEGTAGEESIRKMFPDIPKELKFPKAEIKLDKEP